MHHEEERKLQELENVRAKLEKLLEEETQAKRDEEIVRNLQARCVSSVFYINMKGGQLPVSPSTQNNTWPSVHRNLTRPFTKPWPLC